MLTQLRQPVEFLSTEGLITVGIGLLVLIAFALLTRNIDDDSEDSQ